MSVTVQPYQDEFGNILLWNGEIFRGLGIRIDENDTKVLAQALSKAENGNQIADVIGKVQGPYAFLYWLASQNTLWFGRSFMGHRSLMIHFPNDHCSSLALSSLSFGDSVIYQKIANGNTESKSKASNKNEDDEEEPEDTVSTSWIEVPTQSLYSLSFKKATEGEPVAVIQEYSRDSTLTTPTIYTPFGRRKLIEPQDKGEYQTIKPEYVDQFLSALSDAIQLRVKDLPIAKE
jgi:asparagine synthetase B (glutamine-hydrolysing)